MNTTSLKGVMKNQDIQGSFFYKKLYFIVHKIRVGGMNEGLQILLLGILFQRLHKNNTKFWTKNQVLSFSVVST